MSLTLNNVVIKARKEDNFINATQLCKAGGKLFKNWYQLDATKELIASLEQTLKNEAQYFEQNDKYLLVEVGCDHSRPLLIEIIKIGPNDERGSWVHPDLAVPLAQWISPMFAIQISRWIRELMLTGTVSINSNKTNDELLLLTEQLHEQKQLLLTKELKLEEAQKLLEVEMGDIFWNKIVNQNNLKLNKYIAKFPGLYDGAYEKQNKEEIYTTKAGMTTGSRQNQFNTSSSPKNPFIFRYHKIYHGLESTTEKYIHRILEPLNIKNIVNGRQEGSKEQFMIPKIWLSHFVDKVVSYTNELAEEVNEVINIIESHNRNYDKASVEINALVKTEESQESQEPPRKQEYNPYREDNLEEICKEVKELPEEINQTKADIIEEVKEIRQFINEEHKILSDKLEHLKNDIVSDIYVDGEKSYICKIKVPNIHKAPESHYNKSASGHINHYCAGCKDRKVQLEQLEKQLKEITHNRCSNCGNAKSLAEFTHKTESTYYSSCNACLSRKSRSISKKEALLQKFNDIKYNAKLDKTELSKLNYLIKTLENSTKEILKNKKLINQLGDYKCCNLALSHPDDNLSCWKPLSEFGAKDFRCKECRSLQNKKTIELLV
jgi:hypothetical protein